MRDVGLGRDGVEHRVAERADRGQHPLALLDRAGVRRHQADDRLAVQVLGEERQGRSEPQVGHQAHLVGCVGHEVAQEGEHRRGLVRRPRDQAGQDRRPERLQLEGEVGDDPEVAAAPAQPPEQVGVLGLRGPHDRAVGDHDLARPQRVDRQPHLAHQVADPAAERQPGDAGVADVAAGHRQPEGLALPVDVGVEGAALCRHRPGRRIDDGAPHAGEVEHDAVVHERVSGDAVAAAPHGHGQAAVTRPPQRRGDVAGPLAAGEDGRAAVDLPVPDASLVVVRRVVGRDDVSREVAGKCLGGGHVEHGHGSSPSSVVVLDHSATGGARPASIDPVLVQNP